jgi:hypothetical protein
MSDLQDQADAAAAVAARHREIAVEHLLFGTVRFLSQRHPELLAELEESLAHLWDHADDASRDDEAVRDVARRFLRSLRAERA